MSGFTNCTQDIIFLISAIVVSDETVTWNKAFGPKMVARGKQRLGVLSSFRIPNNAQMHGRPQKFF